MSDDKTNSSIIPLEWAIKDLTQPTLKEVGLDIREGYISLKKIAANAIKKNSKDGIANKRVAVSLLREGGYAESEIAIEYFGGILAQSKTIDGKDDSGIYYTDIIKSLSSKQLHLHYVIYNSLQKMYLGNSEKYSELNMGMENELKANAIFLSPVEMDLKLELDLEKNIFALVQVGTLNKDFEVNNQTVEGKVIPMMRVAPTSLGIQLYSVANGKLEDWRKFNTEDFGNFEDIDLPTIFTDTLDNLPDINNSTTFL